MCELLLVEFISTMAVCKRQGRRGNHYASWSHEGGREGERERGRERERERERDGSFVSVVVNGNDENDRFGPETGVVHVV